MTRAVKTKEDEFFPHTRTGKTVWVRKGCSFSVFTEPHGASCATDIVGREAGREPCFLLGDFLACRTRSYSTRHYGTFDKRHSPMRAIWARVITSRGICGWIVGCVASSVQPSKLDETKVSAMITTWVVDHFGDQNY